MKRTVNALLLLALVCSLLSGCAQKAANAPAAAMESPGPAASEPAPAAEPPSDTPDTSGASEDDEPGEIPALLPISVSRASDSRDLGGGWGNVSYPVYTLGYPVPDGEPEMPDGFDALAAAVEDVNSANAKRAEGVWKRMNDSAPAEGEFPYSYAAAFVTRCDSAVVSFYERTEALEDASLERVLIEYSAHNLDARTGEELKFSDVFRDLDSLPYLLAMQIEADYPDQLFDNDMIECIRRSVEHNDGNISFALGYGCVHIFADESVLNGEPGGQHITLSCALEPCPVKARCTTEPERWLMPLDYDTAYRRGDVGVSFCMHCGEQDPDTDNVLWTVTVDGGATYTEEFYALPPVCSLAHTQEGDFIYLRVPSGDVSMFTCVYELTPEGVKKLTEEPLPLAMDDETALSPDRMVMYCNDYVFFGAGMLFPYAAYRVGGNGLPVMADEFYSVSGGWLRLRESGRYNPPDRADAAVSGGMWTLMEGALLRPYRTDMSSFLDFITEDGRVVRFEIESFGDGMILDNFGTLDDVFY